MKTLQTFEFDSGRTFVCGLFWQPISGLTPADRQAQIKKIAAEQKLDLYVTRTSSIHQAGFGSIADGLQAGFRSAAAVISKSVEMSGGVRNFLCAIEAPNGKWIYVAQREGVILHDGDMLGNEDEIRARMLSDIMLCHWGAIFAPGHWGINNSVEKSLTDFFPMTPARKLIYRRWWQLQPVNKTWRNVVSRYWRIAALGVLAAAGTYGYTLWKEYSIQQEQMRIAAQQAAQANAMHQGAKPLVHPWKTIARAPRFWDGCKGALAQVGTFWPGNWKFKNAACSNGALVVNWVSDGYGWIEHLQAIVPNAEFSPDGKSATLTVPIVLPQGEDEQVPAMKQRKLKMYAVAQRYGLQLLFKEDPAQRRLLPGEVPPTNAANPEIDWKELWWSISAPAMSPAALLPELDAEGFRLGRIEMTFTNGIMKWDMEGVQYVKP